MPRGDKGAYTDKQKRQAEHIEESYEERGTSSKEAARRAWATVNKESGGGKKSGSGRGKKGNKSASKKGGKKGGKKSSKRVVRRRVVQREAAQRKSKTLGIEMASKRKTTSARRATRTKTTNASSKRRLAGAQASSEVVGQLQEPMSPMPAQHQRKPGIESKLRPRPRYQAPLYKGSGKLERKVALITGGDSGIGRAVAVLFAREGADVAFTHLRQEEGDARETQAAIEAEGRKALPLRGDLREPDFCSEAVKQTVKEFGKLDILVNNAAFQQHQESLDELSDDQLDRTFKTNIYAYFRVTKAALPHLRKGSAIVNTGSITGLEGSKGLLDYAATKGAIHAFTKSLAQNLVEKGIRVNCVAPGPVWTPLNPSDQKGKDVAEFGADTPMKRPAQPEEIAPAFVYFASEVDSSYVTGEVLTLLGGETTAG